ncbi:hypothetical protein BDW02DRAFT_596485 [Decorospora gaudefroyi]|uniref:BTB domain-containing protein n=1 Tax=Decorospora gaudefroyi TaxID=184978 RepID=A0A6A5KLA0_9PLEO|nr:hypothetical protein BDW02DRAFT_596485 [Decorospora gaudefroyi]
MSPLARCLGIRFLTTFSLYPNPNSNPNPTTCPSNQPTDFVRGKTEDLNLVVPATPRPKLTEQHRPNTSGVPDAPTKKPKLRHGSRALNDATADFAVVCEGETTINQVSLPGIDTTIITHILSYMYTAHYTLPGGTQIPSSTYCAHRTAALLSGPRSSAQIFKRTCPSAGKVLSPSHLLLHVRIYTVADYLCMSDLKSYARQGVVDVLHVHWMEEGLLQWGLVLDKVFLETPESDRGVRDVLVGVLRDHPGLSVDEGEVRDWLEEHPEVAERVQWEEEG